MDAPASRNIVLTGFMGTGKSTVGRLLADAIDYEFVDTDEVIERRHGPIPEIFAAGGEAEFRRIERDLADALAAGNRRVISTGGRMMLDPAIASALGARSHVFCLTASVDTIATRVLVEGSPVRPLLAGGDPRARIEELLDERAAGYARFEQVATDGRTPADIARTIIDRIRS